MSQTVQAAIRAAAAQSRMVGEYLALANENARPQGPQLVSLIRAMIDGDVARTFPQFASKDNPHHGVTLAIRDLLTTPDSAGGYLAAHSTNVEYVPTPQPTLVLPWVPQITLAPQTAAGMFPLGGTAVTVYWQNGETVQIDQSELTFGQLNISPKTVIGHAAISRLADLQSSPDARGVVEAEIRGSTASQINAVLLNGSGINGQPHGLIGLSGVGTATGSTLARAGLIAAQQAVANSKTASPLVPRFGWVASPDVAALLMARYTNNNSTPLWEGSIFNGTMLGCPALSSTAVPAGTLIFGDWSRVAVVYWSPGIEMLYDPFGGNDGLNFKRGSISIRLALSMDIAVTRPAAFYVITSTT